MLDLVAGKLGLVYLLCPELGRLATATAAGAALAHKKKLVSYMPLAACPASSSVAQRASTQPAQYCSQQST